MGRCMSNGYPATVTVTATDDETVVFTLPFFSGNGSAFPFASYSIEYIVNRAECGSTVFSGTSGTSGVTVSAPNVTFKVPVGTLTPDGYDHACRLKHNTTGEYVGVFGGWIRIEEGQF